MTAVLTREQRVKNVLSELGLERLNAGTSDGVGWFAGDQKSLLHSYDPTTGKLIASVRTTRDYEYSKVVSRVRKAFPKWCMVPMPKRGDLIGDLGHALHEYLNPLAELISIEMGKILRESAGEMREFTEMCKQTQGISRLLGGLPLQSERPQHDMSEAYHPRGVVGIMTSFNFPSAVLGWNRCNSALGGNVDVWKPSSTTPLVAIAIQKICNQIAADHGHPGIFSLVIGSGETVGTWMLEDRRIPLVSFTGSTETGRIVAQTVSKRFGKLILELGGNNAIIVTPHANLRLAVRAIHFGVSATAGQRCTSTRRLIVHESIADELITMLINTFGQIKIGDPLDKDTGMGPLVNNKAVRDMNIRMIHALDRDQGVLKYGAIPGEPSKDTNFVTPAIIKMNTQTPSMRTETFAPILYVITYKTIEEAIAINNDVPQGLSSAIFTENLKEAHLFLSAMGSDCGIANVNCAPSGAEIGGAFGGEKETGGGREAGSDSWKQYMRRQTCTVNWGDDLPLAQGIKFEVEEAKEPTHAELFNERLMKSFDPDKKS